MPNVCLIGNSHVAVLKLGLSAVQSEFPGVRTIFFASDGVSLELESVSDRLVPRVDHVRQRLAGSSGTNGDIQPIYDAYVVCGLTLSSLRAIRTARSTMETVRAEGRNKATPDDVVNGMAQAVQASLAIDVVSKLRQLTAAPIFLIATPYAAYERHAEFWENLQAKGRIGMLAQAFDLACAKAAAQYAAVFVPQPAETVGPNALTTRPEFYRLHPDDVREETAHHTHMNAAFGAIVLRNVLKRIVARLEPVGTSAAR